MGKIITFSHKGDLRKTTRLLERCKRLFHSGLFDEYGKKGVNELRNRTPVDSGKTAESWYYEIQNRPDHISIIWKNSNINDGVNIAIILQYGHGTGNGGYVVGTNYINPAVRPIFRQMRDELWKEVTKK